MVIKRHLSADQINEKAVDSVGQVYRFLTEIDGNAGKVGPIFSKDSNGLYKSMPLGPILGDEYNKLLLTFQPRVVVGEQGSRFSSLPNGLYGVVLFIRYELELTEDGVAQWNKDFVENVAAWFWSKKGYYTKEVAKYLRTQYYINVPTPEPPKRIRAAKPGDKDAEDRLIKFYNNPKNVDSYLRQAEDAVRGFISSNPSKLDFTREFGSSALSFIKTVFKDYVDPEFAKYLSVINRHLVFAKLYELYEKTKEELMKLSVKQLEAFIKSEVKRVLTEATGAEETAGSPKWKDIAKKEKSIEYLPKDQPKQDYKNTAIKDLMGYGGNKVLVKPLDKKVRPEKEKDSNLMQLPDETSDPTELNENKFLMGDLMDISNLRLG